MNKIDPSSSAAPLGNSVSRSDLEQKPDLASFEGTTIQQSQTSSSFMTERKKTGSLNSPSLGERVFQSTRGRSLSEPILPSQTQPKVKIEDIPILNRDTPLHADEIEGLAYTLSSINTFINSYQALDVFRQKEPTANKQNQYFQYSAGKKIILSSTAPTDAVATEEIKQCFISAAQAFYGKDVFNYIFNKTNQQAMLDLKTVPLSLQQTEEIIAKADLVIKEARNYLQLCPSLSIELARAATFDLSHIEKALAQAQKAYAELSTPTQHLLRGTYYALSALIEKIFLTTTVVAGASLAGVISAGAFGLTFSSMAAFAVIDPLIIGHIIQTLHQAPLQGTLTALGMLTGAGVGSSVPPYRNPVTILLGAGLGGLLSGGTAALSLSTWPAIFELLRRGAVTGSILGASIGGPLGGKVLLELFEEPYAHAASTLAQARNEWNQVTTAEEKKREAQSLIQEQQKKLQETEQKFRHFFEMIQGYTETLLDRNTSLTEVTSQQAESLTNLVLLRDRVDEMLKERGALLKEQQALLKQQEAIKAAEEKRVSDRIDQRARFPRGI